MRHAFSILTIVALAVAASLLPMRAADGQPPEPSANRAADGGAAKLDGKASGEVLLDSAIAALESHDSVTAIPRLQIHLLGHHLFGSGSYLQKGNGENRKIRFEIAVQGGAGEQRFTLINDSRSLWVLEDVADNKELKLVNLQRLRNEGMIESGKISCPQLDAVGMGGLAGLMNNLQSSFHFGAAVPIQWNGITVWAMRGGWRPEKLARLTSSSKSAAQADPAALIAGLPDWAPTEVGMLLDYDTLFPYRFEFLRQTKQRKSSTQQLSPIVTMELLEIDFDKPIDEDQFDRPSEIKPVEITTKLLRDRR